MRHLTSFVLAVVILVSGCSHTPTKTAAPVAASAAPKIELLYTSARHLELEPCGCSLAKQGGLAREWNFLEQVRRESAGAELFPLTGGTTFVPIVDKYTAKNRDFYAKKAEFLVEALGKLGVKALSPSAEDFALGMATVKALGEKASFPFVSANLYSKSTGKPIFATHTEVMTTLGPVLVTGVSARADKAYGSSREIIVKAPLESLRATLRALPAAPRLVVVLSSLGAKERAEMIQSVPEVNILFGGNEGDLTFSAEQYTGRFIHSNPADQGRSVARITLQGKSFQGLFYNENASKGFASSRQWWRDSVADYESDLSSGKLKRAEKKEALAMKAKFENYLKRTENIPSSAGASDLNFSYSTSVLTEGLDGAPNEMSALVDRFREAVRSLAVDAN